MPKGMFPRKKNKQRPNEYWRFGCGHDGVLPDYEKHNDVGYWMYTPGVMLEGRWYCAVCHKKKTLAYQQGTGPLGLLTRMRYLLCSGRRNARYRNRVAPNITPEDLLRMWENQNNCCAACDEPIEFLKSHLDHNHDDGTVRGFVHNTCNVIEGRIKKMSAKALRKWLEFYRPEVLKEST